ncbi:MAG: hypothetical protein DMG21_10570 [Acidobacteria bacterium]|nr:MAG: hypothetical protein DMG21_10570 [Acidobacteriota bacterium]
MTEAKEHSANSKPGHETRDASAGPLAAFGLILLGLIIFGLLVSWGVQGYFFKHQSLGPPAVPFENVREMPPANQPPLQINPAQDLGVFRGREKDILTSYGWVDAKAGIARIPIERAMAILLQKGLPTETAPAPQAKPKPAAHKILNKKP